MTKIIASTDCGNSPKNAFLQSLAVALASGDVQYILAGVTEDVRWNIIGREYIQGKGELTAALERMKTTRAVEITIHHVTSHGRAGAVNGTLLLQDGRTRAFCDVYEFSGAKGSSVREITSYVIEVGSGGPYSSPE